jgi:hypothetical protein
MPIITPEHKFQLFITLLSVLAATALGVWALINQRRQTVRRLKVLPSPIMVDTVHGERVLPNAWPGVVVQNVSPFSLRICNIGYRVGKKFYTFGKPVGKNLQEIEWPHELPSRARALFLLNETTLDGQLFINRMSPLLDRKPVWEIARGYAMTECGKCFTSKRFTRKTVRYLRKLFVSSEA